MHSDSTFSIVIVGGGFCGVMSAVNLIEKSKTKTVITLINKGYPLARGIAYKTYSDLHLLNVEARNMSAFPNQPDHFVNWCYQQKDLNLTKDELPVSYLPRNIYGRYLEELFEDRIKNVPPHVRLQIVDDEVVRIDRQNNQLNVITKSGDTFQADRLLLATGNCEPASPAPALTVPTYIKNKNYFSNPWLEDAVLGLKDDQTVLIVGAGLTMVDVVIGLREKNFNGKIISLSPHGYNILPHRKVPPQPYILEELAPPYHLEKLFRLFYKHVREARKRGISGETVVDAIRARTQEIWQQLTLDDKKKFMVHLRHLWGVARHRLPANVHLQIHQLINEEKLEVIAGRIKNISENKNGIEIKIRKRKDQSELILTPARVINCTGPQTDINKQNSPLYDDLLKKGFIKPDHMNLGIDATAEGNTINKNNNISNQIFAIGTLLKGKLWESTAVPELRIQAAKIADLMLNKNEKHFIDFEMEDSGTKSGL